MKPILAGLAQDAPPHALRHAERLVARRIETKGLRSIHASQQVDDVVVRSRDVARHVVLGQVPAAVLLEQLEHALPRFIVGDDHHAAEDAPVGCRAEDCRAEHAVEQPVRARMIDQDQLASTAGALRPEVRLESTLPIRVAE